MTDFGNIIQRLDGSFVINNGLYHVPDSAELRDLFLEVSAYAKAHPKMVEMESAPPSPSPEVLAQARRAEILAELADIDQRSVRPLRAIARGAGAPDETAKLETLEAQAAKLRAELAGLAGACGTAALIGPHSAGSATVAGAGSLAPRA